MVILGLYAGVLWDRVFSRDSKFTSVMSPFFKSSFRRMTSFHLHVAPARNSRRNTLGDIGCLPDLRSMVLSHYPREGVGLLIRKNRMLYHPSGYAPGRQVLQAGVLGPIKMKVVRQAKSKCAVIGGGQSKNRGRR